MSLWATFSSIAKSLRIAMLVPVSAPKRRHHRDERFALGRRLAHADDGVAEREERSFGRQVGVADADAVELRAVQRARVAHAPAAVFAHEAAVEAGDGGVGEDEVVRRVRPDAAEVAVEDERPRGRHAALALNRERQARDGDGVDELADGVDRLLAALGHRGGLVGTGFGEEGAPGARRRGRGAGRRTGRRVRVVRGAV